MDIEGAELGALKGMKRLLEQYHPMLLMELHPPSIIEYGAKPKDVYDFVQSLGYQISVPDAGQISFEELEKLAVTKVGTNILCQ